MKFTRLCVAATTAALVTASAFVSGLGAGTANADSEHSDAPHLVSDQHKPGVLAVRERVPEDQTMPDGSPHPCAGRYLVYRDHVDPVYLTTYDGKPRMMVVAGSAVVPADSVCMRLGPDSFRGIEMSRLVVPNDPNWRFLGKPGRIVWYAPYTRPDNAAPLWAGIGAFEPAHEKEQPDIFNSRVNLILSDFRGPGRMNIFVDRPNVAPVQLLNSAEPEEEDRVMELSSGGHAHMSFAFTKAGIYHTVWKGTYSTGSFLPMEAPPEDIVWLVGENEDVGLPADFPRVHDRPQTSAEDIRAQLGLTDPHDDFDGVVQVSTVDTTKPRPSIDDKGVNGLEEYFAWNRWFSEDVLLPPGVTMTAAGSGMRPVDHPDATHTWVTVANNANSLTCFVDTPANSDLRDKTVGGWLWSAGTSENPGVTYDMSSLPDIDVKAPVTVIPSLESRGYAGVLAMGRWNGNEFVSITRSDSSAYGNFVISDPSQPYHVDFAFTRPGLYTAGLQFNYTKTNGESATLTTSNYYVVGNDAINTVYDKVGVEPKLDASERADETCAEHSQPVAPVQPTDPDPVTPDPVSPIEPTDPAPGGDGSVQPDPQQQRVCLAYEAWNRQVPQKLLTHGHMDLGLDESGRGIVRDTADPRQVIDHPSGTFVFDLGTQVSASDSLPISKEDKESDFANGAFYIPEVQEVGRVWVGFATEHYPYEQTADGISVTMAPVVMPEGGRIIVGQGGTTMLPWRTFLDTAHPELVRSYPGPVHEHPQTFVNKAGLYVLRYTFSWTDSATAEQRSADVVATYIAGEQGADEYTAIRSQDFSACGDSEQPTPPVDPVDPNPVDPNPGESKPGEPNPGESKPGEPGQPSAGVRRADSGQGAGTAGTHGQQPNGAVSRVLAQGSDLPAVTIPGSAPAFPAVLHPQVSSTAGAQATPVHGSGAGASGTPSATVGSAESDDNPDAEATAAPRPVPTETAEAAGAFDAHATPTGTPGLLIGILLGAGGVLGLGGLLALIAALILALRRRHEQ